MPTRARNLQPAKLKTAKKVNTPIPKAQKIDPSSPEVIVDFIFDEGLLFIAIKNISDRPALKVSTKFTPKIFGLNGSKEISALPLFKNIEFLAPQKEIVTFLDSSASYFTRGGATKIAARITYQDSNRKKYTATIKHDLEIYKDIAYI